MRSTRYLALWMAVSCAEPPPPMPDPSRVSLEGIPRSVRGSIDGERFAAAAPRFVVVEREGRERVDLLFADRRIERCGLPVRRSDRRVWIRFAGQTSLAPGTYDELDVHYEIPAERGFRAEHRGLGRLEIRAAGAGSIEGAMHVCFADAAQSCVAGSFRATRCISRIDGRALREGPGLSDEAIETAGTAP